ncbi:hypothetical protein GVX82_02415 [Patescibacteria group bacterium]|jgi:uncharacterized membrane protein|nr:hypothetical protein [Patescibacteria group bacterium]
MQPRFVIGRVVRFSWGIFRDNAPFLVGLYLALIAFALGNQFLATAVAREISLLIGSGVFLAGLLFMLLMWMGMKFLMLKLVRRERVSHELLLSPAPALPRYVAGTLLYQLITFIGYLLLIVPGIIWSVQYVFFRHAIVDRGLGPLEALALSARITEGVRFELLLVLCVLGLINLLGLLALGIGLLVTLPWTELVLARVYDRLLRSYEAGL